MNLPDPFEFARRGQSLHGEVPVSRFERLLEVVRPAGLEALLSYRWQGVQKGDEARLELEATGELVLACQRCLADVICAVDARRRFLLVPEGDPLPDDDLVDDLEENDFDPIHAGRNLDVLELLEDEILLSLPTFPMHDRCAAPAGVDVSAGQVQDTVSPFAALGKLKRED